jgi:hypothetical protein
MLLWQVYHQAVAVNVWRGQISSLIDQSCPLCEVPEAETVFHRFWRCPFSQQLWSFSIALLGYLGKLPADQMWPPDWTQSIFASFVPSCFQSISFLWSLLRGLTMLFSSNNSGPLRICKTSFGQECLSTRKLRGLG